MDGRVENLDDDGCIENLVIGNMIGLFVTTLPVGGKDDFGLFIFQNVVFNPIPCGIFYTPIPGGGG